MDQVKRNALGILVFCLIALCFSVRADDTQNFGLQIYQTFSSNLQKTSSANYSSAHGTTLVGIYQLPFKISTSLVLSASKGLTGTREFDLDDGVLSASKPLLKRGEFRSGLAISALIPLSESSKKNRLLATAITVSSSNTYSPGKLKGFSFSLTPSARSYFFEIEVAKSGSSNPQFRTGLSTAVNYAITSQLIFGAKFEYLRYFTYLGSSYDRYSNSQTLTYTFSNYSMTLGHSIGGDPLAVNGVDQKIELFDSNQSSIYATLGAEL